MTPEDEKFERIAQRHIADLKKSSKAIVEDAAVRAAHKVMAEFAQGAHTEAKVEYHTTMIHCPHCDGSVRVQAQPYPDNFIDALKYDVAKRDSEAQQHEPVANASTWFALVMNAAAELEDASHCLRDEDAKRVAISGAKYFRDEANALYTSPPHRKPLTDEDLRKLADKHLFYQPEGYEVSGVFSFARAIEAAHGIKGEA